MKTYPTGDAFTDSYIATALWSSSDESTPDGGLPLDQNYTYSDLSPETFAIMVSECARFQIANRELLDWAQLRDDCDASHQGHDFWLTRNGHGAGFWDGDYPVTGDALTTASKLFKPVDLYIGDDGKIYQS